MNYSKVCMGFVFTLVAGCNSDSGEENAPIPPTAIEQALATADVSYIDDASSIVLEMNSIVNQELQAEQAIKQALFNIPNGVVNGDSLTNLTWWPTHDAAAFKNTYGVNYSVIESNAIIPENDDGSRTPEALPVAIAGQYKQQGRYLALNSNPFRNVGRNENALNTEMESWLKNTVSWLSQRDDFSSDTPLNIVMSQLDDSYYFKDRTLTRKWFDEQYPDKVTYNAGQSCDGPTLASCITEETDLVILSQYMGSLTDEQVEDYVAQVETLLAQGTPVLYVHHDGNLKPLGKALFELLNITYIGDNYWRKFGTNAFNVMDTYQTIPADIEKQIALFNRLDTNSFTVDLSLCDDHKCEPESLMDEQFYQAASSIKAKIDSFDKSKKALFTTDDFKYQKLQILLADKYRQDTVFPMNRADTNANVFLRSLFSDYVLFNNRLINAAQADLGNFSRSDFSHITPVDKQISLTTRGAFQAAGVYMLPGKTVTISRNDSLDVNTSIFINTLRSGSTHEFLLKDGYSRPKFIKSQAYSIASGETLTLTSAYGGLLQVGFDTKTNVEAQDPTAQVNFIFANVGLHPVWRNDSDSESFVQQLAANQYDWAEFITANFQVHSTRSKMLKTMSDPTWSDLSLLASTTQKYTHGYEKALGGFEGPNIEELSEVVNFANAKGLALAYKDQIHHFNADRATCGSGCSGNPYDANWQFNPLGHGDLHEIGHTQESGRFRFTGWDSHSTTNYYSYFTKFMNYKKTGNAPTCQKLKFETMFNHLKASKQQGVDSYQYMQDLALNSWSNGAMIMIQAMMGAQNEGTLTTGWHLIARLHVLDRNFTTAVKKETTWLAARDVLGFSQYSQSEAKSIGKNEWLAIAISTAIERDVVDFSTMWGLAIDDKAKAQLAATHTDKLPLSFYASDNNGGYCMDLAQPKIALSADMVWPY
ncbi:ImpA family metalloprotease [Moritella sp. 24]|uniref:ImpA family metalloprotease n=1 Tax=Moritella sp. 24 TaxID=2746230 RepID=UPI002105430B|nr:ImpA family metalloprotease [Moritella sp. 24]